MSIISKPRICIKGSRVAERSEAPTNDEVLSKKNMAVVVAPLANRSLPTDDPQFESHNWLCCITKKKVRVTVKKIAVVVALLAKGSLTSGDPLIESRH